MNLSLPTNIINNISLTLNNNNDENQMTALMKLQRVVLTKKLVPELCGYYVENNVRITKTELSYFLIQIYQKINGIAITESFVSTFAIKSGWIKELRKEIRKMQQKNYERKNKEKIKARKLKKKVLSLQTKMK